MLIFPEFNSVALQLGPLAIRWYGLAYVAGLLLGLSYVKHLMRRFPVRNLAPESMDDLFVWVVLGVILGGRLGFVIFYDPVRFLHAPLDILKVWQGGMSFHGGALGVILAMFVFAWKRKVHPLDIADRVVCVVPIGLFFGRLANFVNGELWGRPTSPNLPWAMVFPHVDSIPRHPSQLYEAGLEGIVLFLCLWLATRTRLTRWEPSGIFLTGYALARIFIENFRTPEIVHDFGFIQLTQGQTLSLPMLAIGMAMLYVAGPHPKANR
jgi:phosphatidylglycerol:prolipoprotein diacylglycerol transferase